MNVHFSELPEARQSCSRSDTSLVFRLRRALIALLFCVGPMIVSGSLSADTVVGWDLTGSEAAVEPPTTVAPGVTGIDLTIGPGINNTGLANGYSTNGWDRAVPGRDTALSNGDYFQIGFTVEAGHHAFLSALDVSMRRSALNAPMFYEWQYSFDGFATPGVTILPVGPVWDTFAWTESYFNYFGRSAINQSYLSDEPYLYMTARVDGLESAPMPPIVLSGVPALQAIPAGTEVTFRLYAWGNSNTAASNSVALGRFDGPVISGAVGPEGQTPLTIVSAQPGTDPAVGSHFYVDGSEVTATAPNEVMGENGVRYRLAGWTATGLTPDAGEGNSVTFTLDGPVTVEWHWETEHRLSVATQGEGTVRVRTSDPFPLLGFDFANYRYHADGVYPEGEISNEFGVPSSTMGDGVALSTITRGSGLTPRDLAMGGISSENWNGTPSLADAISGGKYMEFNVTPTGGASLEVNSIYVPYRYTQTGPHSIALLYSFDNFSTYTVAESRQIQDQASGTNTDSHLFVLPSDPQLRQVTGELKFRIYGWGGTGTGVGTFAIFNEKGANIDDMTVFGAVSTQTFVAGSQDFWLNPQTIVELEALPSSGSLFTGWSGQYRSNVSILSGLTLESPLSFQAHFETDSDGDGMPDSWEMLYFGNLSSGPGDDSDQDGFTHLEEYRLGLNPIVAEELAAIDQFPVTPWENVQRDPLLPGQFIIRDFGNGFRGVWENSNDNRSAMTPFHPDGESVNPVGNVSYDGPRMIVREEAWDESWGLPTVSTVFSVGDNDGNCLYFNYQDELNWHRVTVTGEQNNALTRPAYGVSVDKRVNGQYSQLAYSSDMATEPEDLVYFKRVRVTVEQDGTGGISVTVAGWDAHATPADWGYQVTLPVWDGVSPGGRAGIGSWAQGGHSHTLPEWNPVDNGVLFESFTVSVGENQVFHEDWSGAELAGLPAGWENPFVGDADFEGNWRTSAHGTLAQMSAQGGVTSGTVDMPRADADGPVLLGPAAPLSSYLLDLGIHAFNPGAAGFVFDFKDTDNYGRVLFARTYGDPAGSIPTGVVVSRKTGGVWSEVLVEDRPFAFTEGKPFRVQFSRLGSGYVMNVSEIDDPAVVHRWEWDDATAASGAGRYGFTSWQATDVHYLYSDVYGVVFVDAGDLKVTAIEKVGESIVLTVENDSGAPYQVERTLDVGSGEWETVDTDQTGTTWTGPIPAGADRAFWRLIR